ncbi:hypothetical protein [Enhygromyxa salina]|uniref:Uncharacterized protein n=1 Tax=Enhygromyxa salina TaxID=215803 RepID=A0A2S9XT34_9BACT|nr:hypothetical protein [Enhygromyxa salina]PRP96027.1 hypothetical protein ENSA7_68410 [Enhygromyxa salina]
MRHAAIVLPGLLAIACESSPQTITKEPTKQTRAAASQPSERTPPAPEKLVETWPPAIPSLLLEKLEIERAGSFILPEGTNELTPRAAVALDRGFALVGEAVSIDGPAQTRRWVGFVSTADRVSEGAGVQLGTGSIHAAISDDKGGALLVGDVGSWPNARGWFGTLDAKGAVTTELELASEAPTQMFDLLAGHGPEQRALLVGNVDARGLVVSIGPRGDVRWQTFVSNSGATQIHASARVHGVRGNVLAIGTRAQGAGVSESWWSTIADGPAGTDARVEQGRFQIAGADPDQVLEVIVDLGDDIGFLALGRARRDLVQDHDQIIAVGFDRTGAPTWSRALEYFRGMEIYGAAVDPERPGIANFVVRIPIGGDKGRSALGWLDICPGVDGILIPRQLAGTEGWASAGFIEGREGRPAILTYARTETGIDWRVLPLSTSYYVGAPS